MTRELFAISLLLLAIAAVQQVSCRLVIVNVASNDSSDSTGLCALYGLSDNKGLDEAYSLVKTVPIATCQNRTSFSLKSNAAIFLEFFNDECSFEDIYTQIEVSNTSFVLIGANYLVVSKLFNNCLLKFLIKLFSFF
jgi:hypothetical protein